MKSKLQPVPAQFVPVVEADIFDRMNETNALIAERAYELYQSRGGGHGSDQDDWFRAEQEILSRPAIEEEVIDGAVQLTAQVPGFEAKDLEVSIGHDRAAICGVHSNPNQATKTGNNTKRVLQIVDLPFAVDPLSATATLQGERLKVVLPRSPGMSCSNQ
jgi:HSP20 family molecular chaperone IbpA